MTLPGEVSSREIPGIAAVEHHRSAFHERERLPERERTQLLRKRLLEGRPLLGVLERRRRRNTAESLAVRR